MTLEQQLESLQKRYDELFVAAMDVVQLASQASRAGGISFNRDGIRKGCDVIFTMFREKERLEELDLDAPYEFRKEPNSLEECLKWGMISIRQYKRVKHLPFEQAKEVIGGYQTWSLHADHIVQYVHDRHIRVNVDFANENAFITHCIKKTAGKINPIQVRNAYAILTNSI